MKMNPFLYRKAKKLLGRGFRRKDIAKLLGVSLRTASRLIRLIKVEHQNVTMPSVQIDELMQIEGLKELVDAIREHKPASCYIPKLRY